MFRAEARSWKRVRNAEFLQKQHEGHELDLALARRVDAHFLLGIWRAPADTHLRLVYADWLEEHGQLGQATVIRLEAQVEALPADDPQRAPREREWDGLVKGSVGEGEELAGPTWRELWSHVRGTCARCGESIRGEGDRPGNCPVEYCPRCGVSLMGDSPTP